MEAEVGWGPAGGEEAICRCTADALKGWLSLFLL